MLLFLGSRILGAILNARARRAVAWTQELPGVQQVLDTMQKHRIKPHENELRFVRQLVDRGSFDHSWLPADPNVHVKRVRKRERGWLIWKEQLFLLCHACFVGEHPRCTHCRAL